MEHRGTGGENAKHWAFTGWDLDEPAPEARLFGMYSYMVYGVEQCPSTQRKHWQGYVVLTGKHRMASLKKKTSTREWHWTIARNNPDVNRKYCIKDGDFREFGTIPLTVHQARDAKVEEIRDLARSGKIEEIGDKYPSEYLRYIGNLERISKRNMVIAPDADDVTGIWIQGSTGCGKTRYVKDNFPDAYDKLPNKWWDGYQGDDHVLIDDLGPSHEVLGYHLKRWLDRYSFPAETKGGMTNIRPKKVIITTQYTMAAIFSDEKLRDAIQRRCEVIDMGGACDVRKTDLLHSNNKLFE